MNSQEDVPIMRPTCVVYPSLLASFGVKNIHFDLEKILKVELNQAQHLSTWNPKQTRFEINFGGLHWRKDHGHKKQVTKQEWPA